jgi:hypothetical protein
MKISDVVQQLTKIKDEHGDLPVWVFHEWGEPVGKVEYYPGSDNPNLVQDEVVVIEGGG